MQTTGRSARTLVRRNGSVLAMTTVFTAVAGWSGTAKGAYSFTNLGPADDVNGSIGIYTPGVSLNNQATLEIAATTNTRATYSVGGGPNSLAILGGANAPAFSESYGVNDGGTVVGSIVGGNGDQAFYTNGTTTAFTTIGSLGGGSSDAYAVNRTGALQIVGQSTYSGQQLRAFTWTATTGMVGLDSAATTGLGGTGGGAVSAADGLNSSGLIVGFATNNAEDDRGFLYVPSKSKMYDLGSVAGTTGNSQANAINTAGLIVGQTDVNATYSQAFIYNGYNTVTLPSSGSDVSLGGSMTTLGAFDHTSSDALAVNDSGLVVGWSSVDANGDTHAFVYNSASTSSGLQDLNNLVTLPTGYTLDEATGINTAGDITGIASNSSGATYAFLLTPTAVPEPGPFVLMMFGAAMALRPSRQRTGSLPPCGTSLFPLAPGFAGVFTPAERGG